MPTGRKHETSKLHRILIIVFSVVFAILVFWLLGFILDDIGSIKAPQFDEVEKRHLDKNLIDRSKELGEQIEENKRMQRDHSERQALLRDSTNSSKETMNQLLEMQKLSLQKGVRPSEAEQKALAESESLFLSNQRRYQEINEDTVKLSEQQRSLQEEKRKIEATLGKQREPARKEHASLMRKHSMKIAAIKLLVLVPLLLLAAGILYKSRKSIYVPLIFAAGIALFVRVALVIHEYFPSRIFKYILLLVAIALVFQLLIFLIRMAAFPKKEWLLKQYREAYEKFYCPVCGFPIRRGPHKYIFWTSRNIAKQTAAPAASTFQEEVYSCPACGAQLYEKCDACQSIRHSLLPYCEKCSVEKEMSVPSK